jgi:hypothetical protein
VKLRAGFVSNSSSTSFVVAFPKGFHPTTEAVRIYLFGPRSGRARSLPVGEIAAAVYAQMTHQHPNDLALIQNSLGGFPGSPRLAYNVDHPERNKVSPEKAIAIYNVEYRQKLEPYLIRRLGRSTDIYGFTFWDDGGDPIASAIVNKYRFRGIPHLGGRRLE